MSERDSAERLGEKTPEAALLHILRSEFNFSPRVSSEVLQAAKELLVDGKVGAAIRPG